MGSEVSNLWLEGADQVLGGVHDVCAEFENAIWLAAQMHGEFAGIGVESDAQQRALQKGGMYQLFNESHGVNACQAMKWSRG